MGRVSCFGSEGWSGCRLVDLDFVNLDIKWRRLELGEKWLLNRFADEVNVWKLVAFEGWGRFILLVVVRWEL